MPKFKEFIPVKLNVLNNTHTIHFMGYDIIARNIIDCKKYNKLQKDYFNFLMEQDQITLKSYIEITENADKWCKDSMHPAIKFYIYDSETNTYSTSIHFLTRHPKESEKSEFIQVLINEYVAVNGSITDINPNDYYAQALGVNLDYKNLNFDDEAGCYLRPDGNKWVMLTKENTDLIAKKLIKKFSENATLIKKDQTDFLYGHDALLKENITEEDLSKKTPEEIDEILHERASILRCPDHIIEKIKVTKSHLLKQDEDIEKKIVSKKPVSGIIDEE